MTYTEARHQGAIETFWLHLFRAVKLSSVESVGFLNNSSSSLFGLLTDGNQRPDWSRAYLGGTSTHDHFLQTLLQEVGPVVLKPQLLFIYM